MSIMLGRGWQFPLHFNARTKRVAMVTGVEDVEESLRILMATYPGERVMLPAYGCNVRRMVFETLSENTLTELKETIRKAILFFEPRITVLQLDLTLTDPLEGRLDVSLDYSIRTTNTRHNLVYPLYLKQATNPVSVS
ncbi:MAG: GPW/gp25 family protein [Burkholderiales bacterium]|nr:GPW/gp25 family protein [Burkholderiales bacterium]